MSAGVMMGMRSPPAGGEGLINGYPAQIGGYQDPSTIIECKGHRRRAPPTHPMRESKCVSSILQVLHLARKCFPCTHGVEPFQSTASFSRTRGVESLPVFESSLISKFPPMYMGLYPIVSLHDEALLYFLAHVGCRGVENFSPKTPPRVARTVFSVILFNCW